MLILFLEILRKGQKTKHNINLRISAIRTRNLFVPWITKASHTQVRNIQCTDKYFYLRLGGLNFLFVRKAIWTGRPFVWTFKGGFDEMIGKWYENPQLHIWYVAVTRADASRYSIVFDIVKGQEGGKKNALFIEIVNYLLCKL